MGACGSPHRVPAYLCQRKEMHGQSRVHSVPLSVLRLPSLKPFYRDKDLFLGMRDRFAILGRQILTRTRMEYRLLALLEWSTLGGCASADSLEA
jgi:hypothetical protein